MDIKDSDDNKKDAETDRAEMKDTLKIVIKESIKSDIITKAEGDKVLASCKG